jgi:hypothetical protein
MRHTRSFMTSRRGLWLRFQIIRTLIAKEIALNHFLALVSSIKGEVKEKHISSGWTFPCSAAHLIEQDLF